MIDFRIQAKAHARNNWESGLLARVLLDLGHDDPEGQKGLLKVWLPGMFNAATHNVVNGAGGAGLFEWKQADDGERYDLIWHAPYGVSMYLARAYPQPNGSYASLIVAGVKSTMHEAMAAAEWALSRLSGA